MTLFHSSTLRNFSRNPGFSVKEKQILPESRKIAIKMNLARFWQKMQILQASDRKLLFARFASAVKSLARFISICRQKFQSYRNLAR